MSPRRSAAEAAATRDRLLDEAASLTTVEGLDGMSLGSLADATGLSKSGVTRHFPSKTELQLETLDRGFARFAAAVWDPVADREPGIERLRAIAETWTAFLAGETFPGGCFLSAVSAEFDTRPGPVRDRIAAALKLWMRTLEADARRAVDAGELTGDPCEVAYELQALALAANQARQLLGDETAPARSRGRMLALLEPAG